jgi:hypothetical protein
MFDSIARSIESLEENASVREIALKVTMTIQDVYVRHVKDAWDEGGAAFFCKLREGCEWADAPNGDLESRERENALKGDLESGERKNAPKDDLVNTEVRLLQINKLAGTMVKNVMDVNSKYLQKMYRYVAQGTEPASDIVTQHKGEVDRVLTQYYRDMFQ